MLHKVVPEAVYFGVIELGLGEGREQCKEDKGGDGLGADHLEIEIEYRPSGLKLEKKVNFTMIKKKIKIFNRNQ